MEKFDVFISFKNTDSNGKRTQDSFMAEELYYALKEKNINAFYSNISIPESGEFEFGDMIDTAIEQCSIIVVVGTSIENFNSKWVSHEFKTFRHEILSGNKVSERSAMFSYITPNVNTNQLPMALRYCQAFTSLPEVVNSVCARFKKEKEIVKNFAPVKPKVDSLGIGTIIDGKYEILREVGRGGMSIVYLAMDLRINKQWAIKVLRKNGVQDFEIVKQGLIAEANLLKKMDHPNLPRIIDLIDTDDSFIIIMDYIEGESLNHILDQYGAQSEENVLKWAKQLCDVLGYLHTRTPAIIYRDMKPANVMLRPNGSITLIDFGIAREFKEMNLADTTCLGTRGYAAPEQFGGMGQTDARTDIYCLGVTLYNLVTNLNPAEPPYEIKPIREVDSKLSKGLEYVIEKATLRDPEFRYQSIAEMLYDLENLDKTAKKANKAAKSKKIGSIFSSDRKRKKSTKVSTPNSIPFAIPKSTVPVKKNGDSVPVYSIPNPYFVPSNGGNKFNMGDTTPLPLQCDVTVDTDVLGRYSVFVTSTQKFLKNSEVQLRFYMVTDKNKDSIKELLLKEPEYNKFVASDIFSLPSDAELSIVLDSNVLFFNKHRFSLSSEHEAEMVKAVASPLLEDDARVGLNIHVESEKEILDKIIFEWINRG